MSRRASTSGAVLVAFVLVLAACGSPGGRRGSTTTTAGAATLRGQTVTLLTHASFAVSKGVLASFTRATGIKVRVLKGDDANVVVNQAILTRDKPQGDALFGVDNALLSRAVERDLFARRSYRGLGALEAGVRRRFAAYTDLVVPVDSGDVCLNYDVAWFARRRLPPPSSLGDLTKPAYKGLTVVENPATSSPGLAFLLATIARFGDGWRGYWRDLRRNDVLAVDGWEQAYTGEFTAGGGSGTRPIVVSYASSPPADVVYADPPKARPATAAVLDGCFRQYEFAGVLANAARPDAAQRLVEFLVSARFQADMPLNMFVFPVRAGVPLPRVFEQFAPRPPRPLAIPPAQIARSRDAWIRAWTAIVAG